MLIALALVAAAGLSFLTFTGGTDEVYVAAVDLPAYHQLTQADIRLMPVDRRQVPPGAVHERDTLLGRYTMTAARQDQPFQISLVGPRLQIGPRENSIVALPSSPETTVGGRLARGDRVDILLSPNSAAKDAASARRIVGVLVLDLIDGPNAAVIVAMTQWEVNELMAGRGNSTVIVVRTQPYLGP